MRRRILSLFILACTIINIFSGCSAVEENMKVIENELKVETASNTSAYAGGLSEDRGVYNDDNPRSIVHLYVTVLKENNIQDGKIVTLSDLNRYRNDSLVRSPKIEVIIQEGTAEGLKLGYFGYGTKTANASMEVRGKSATTAAQKSYKLKLYDKAGLWDNQKTINLNKHPGDFTRVRNKLSFDFFKMIPNMTSLRTQFVNLHIKDLSNSLNSDKFINYGLYTHIEQPNKMFLKSHGLDPNAHLYKAEYFEFLRYPEQLKLVDDQGYKKEEFERILSIEGNEDHRKLLAMLDDVNNYNLDINKVVDKHFNRDNMLTWLASNILMGNIDTISQNFMLYSPLNLDTWFFLPWDYDGAWGAYNQIGADPIKVGDWQNGLSNYWGMVLFKRFFKDAQNIKALNGKVEDLYKIINKEKTKEFLSTYHDTAYDFVKQNPDLQFMPSRIENYEPEYMTIPDEPEKNRHAYYDNQEKPMPFFLDDPVTESNKITFDWDWSYDLQGDSINYEFQLSTDPDFVNIVAKKEKLIENKYTLEMQLEGIYYWRVIAYDSSGNRQKAFDEYKDSQGNKYFGVKQFTAKKQ